jgi:ABC-type multidrug transport system permease subunit
VFPKDIPRFWKFLHHVSPFTYLVKGLLSAGLGSTSITCSQVEQLRIKLPTSQASAGITCQEYLTPFLNNAGGYITESHIDRACLYCPVGNTDIFFASVGIKVNKGWQNAGFLTVFVIFNTLCIFGFYWLFRDLKSRK